MSGENMVGVHTGALGDLGRDFKRSASTVHDQVKRVNDHKFGSAEAGRNYAGQGAAVQEGLDRISKWLENWSDATSTTGDALGAAVVAYSDTDRQRAVDTAKL